MRLIDADELKETLKCIASPPCNCDTCDQRGSNTCIQCVTDWALRKAPTIESVKRGEWINTYGDTPHDPRDKNYWWHCSECGHSVSTSFKSNFCPRCGAKMDGEKQ